MSNTPKPCWGLLFDHMDAEHKLTLLDSELYEIARKVDECRLNEGARTLTKPELQDRAKAFLKRLYGIPRELDEPAQDRFMERSGLLYAFVDELMGEG